MASRSARKSRAAGLLVVGMLALLGVSATPVAATPPLMQALSGRWFSVSVSGSYSQEWSADVTDACDPGTDPEFFKGAASETISFASRRPIRLYGFEAITPTLRDGPEAYLLLKPRFVRPGTRLSRDDFGGAWVPAPAVFRRSLTGTYRVCAPGPGYPQPIKTVPPISCPTLRRPGFRVLVGWDQQVGGRGVIDGEGLPPEQTGLYEHCADPTDDLPAIASQNGLPDWKTEVSNALVRPTLARFLTAPKGTTIVCSRLTIPVALPYHFHGVQHGERETLTVRFRVPR